MGGGGGGGGGPGAGDPPPPHAASKADDDSMVIVLRRETRAGRAGGLARLMAASIPFRSMKCTAPAAPVFPDQSRPTLLRAPRERSRGRGRRRRVPRAGRSPAAGLLHAQPLRSKDRTPHRRRTARTRGGSPAPCRLA